MSSTPVQHPVIRRFSQVYVEIPPSPLHKTRIVSGSSLLTHTQSSNRKENVSLQSSSLIQAQDSTASSPNRKRKLSESCINMNIASVESTASFVKKAKVIHKPITNKAKTGTQKPQQTSEEFPNGWFYCHQCNKKRDSGSSIQCTMKDPKHVRCKVKFCPSCLTNRQGQSAAEIKSAGRSGNDADHVNNETYIWKCPKCRDVCNCARCRKVKGLEPTGNLTTVAKRTGGGSAAALLSKNPATVGIMPGKGTHQCAPLEKKPKLKQAEEQGEANTSAKVKGKPGRPPKAKTKPLPVLYWSKVPLDRPFSLSEAERRIQIREFVLRFACTMDPKSVSRKTLEELEEIGGRGRSWDSDKKDENRVTGWVSEACVKGILMGLLGLIQEDENGKDKRLIVNTIKDLRASGVNLNKMWASLASLRDNIAESSSSSEATKSISRLPNPSPPPASATFHNTRNARVSTMNTIYIAYSSQMVPVLVALTEAAMETVVVKAEIEEGVKEGKDKTREGREGLKLEQERWEKLKEKEKDPKSKEAKPQRELHKRIVQDYEESIKVAMSAYAPRFGGPLGKDMDGRLYWALSPGTTERENAIITISESVGDGSVGKKVRKVIPNDDERKGMRKWSWFVAVWGKKPELEGGELSKSNRKFNDAEDTSDSEDEDEGSDEDDWWGIWDPVEINKAADWIEIRAGLDEDKESSEDRVASPVSEYECDMHLYGKHSTNHELKSLVKSLRDYACLLEWRAKENDDVGGRGNGKEAVR